VTFQGPNDPTNPGGEASLDIQYLMGLAPVETMFYSNGDLYNGQEPFLEWTVFMANQSNPPVVQSISYADQVYSLSIPYMQRLDIEFQKLGLMGVSLFFAAGDDGVGGFDARGNASYCNKFNPAYPSASAYVTSIGGTMLATTTAPFCNVQQPFGPASLQFSCDSEFGLGEIVSSSALGSRITGGGGFSGSVSATPSWQLEQVESYLLDPSVPPRSLFNASGRAYPDVSTNAHNYVIFLNGTPVSVDGTSASTPVFAAMIALISTLMERPLGFINYVLYSNLNAFTDVVYGSNACTASTAVCCPYGFSAVRGYDPASGLGYPNFVSLFDAFAAAAKKH